MAILSNSSCTFRAGAGGGTTGATGGTTGVGIGAGKVGKFIIPEPNLLGNGVLIVNGLTCLFLLINSCNKVVFLDTSSI